MPMRYGLPWSSTTTVPAVSLILRMVAGPLQPCPVPSSRYTSTFVVPGFPAHSLQVVVVEVWTCWLWRRGSPGLLPEMQPGLFVEVEEIFQRLIQRDPCVRHLHVHQLQDPSILEVRCRRPWWLESSHQHWLLCSGPWMPLRQVLLLQLRFHSALLQLEFSASWASPGQCVSPPSQLCVSALVDHLWFQRAVELCPIAETHLQLQSSSMTTLGRSPEFSLDQSIGSILSWVRPRSVVVLRLHIEWRSCTAWPHRSSGHTTSPGTWTGPSAPRRWSCSWGWSPWFVVSVQLLKTSCRSCMKLRRLPSISKIHEACHSVSAHCERPCVGSATCTHVDPRWVFLPCSDLPSAPKLEAA